jgi:hypothetical protein
LVSLNHSIVIPFFFNIYQTHKRQTMNTMNTNRLDSRGKTTAFSSYCHFPARWATLSLYAVLALLTAAGSAFAQQTVELRAWPVRVTVPVNGTITNSIGVVVTIANGTDPVNLTVTGLPSGAGATLDTSSFTASGTATLTLATTNLPQGEYDVAIEASGAASYRLPLPVISSYIWSGASGTAWSSAGNWVGGAAPGAGANVVFSDIGGTNANTVTNVVVSGNTEIASLRFSQWGPNETRYHNFEIVSGATLAITGAGGLTQLRDVISVASRPMDVKIAGGGTLMVNHETANITSLVDYNVNATLDMRDLNNFVADVNRIGFGDWRLYPNFSTNGYTGAGTSTNSQPSRYQPQVWLAKTNIIKASWVDPNNYNDLGIRDYALTIGNQSRQGTTSNLRLSLGLSNYFELDSICWGQAGSGGSGNNYNFNAANSVALFNGIGGGRMSVWAQGDAGGVDNSGSNTRGVTVNFSNGRVEAFVDRMFMGLNRTNTTGQTIQATLTFATGFFDANTAYLGYQGIGENLGTGASAVSGPTGTVNVNSNGVFRVNQTLHLGYTTGATPGTPTYPENASGILNLAGGTAMVSNILIGGVTKLSVANNITMSAGGTLIVSNRIATSDKWLTTLNMANSTLALHINGASSDPYVYVTNLITGGAGNTLKLASVSGVISYPAVIPVIAYNSAAPNFSVEFPAGLYGYVVNNEANKTVDVVISDVPPKNVVWNGTPGNIWNTSAANWQGAQVFVDGDSATFDDSAAGSTTVNITGTVIPGSGGVLISNETKAYTLTGGTIAGTGVITKEGAASLTVDASSQLALNVNEGDINGSGDLGVVTLASGTTLNYSGDITRLNTAATSTSSGNIIQGLTVSDGVFVNTGTVNGSVSMTGGVTTNNGTFATTGVSTLAAGAILVHNGQFNAGTANANSRLSVAGTVTGTGIFTDTTGDANANNGRFSLDAGGVLSPGNNGIGKFSIEGRFDLNQNARVIIEVDLNNPQKHDIVAVDKWSNTRGIIQMTNIGTIPFAIGQSFMVISNNFGAPNTPEAASDFSIDPRSPGVGLQWDVSNLKTNGILAIVAAPTIPPMLTNVFTATNLTLTWPTNYLGWQLQVQTNDLNTGLTDTWYSVPGSESTSQQVWPIVPANPTVFFRLYSITP